MKWGALALMIASLLFGSSANAAEYRTAGNYPACVTKQFFDEAVSALVAGDEKWFQQLRVCIITKPGLKIAPIERSCGTTKARLFTVDGDSIILWTNSENLKRID